MTGRFATALLAVVLGLGAAGCAASTPRCAEGAGLVEVGQLGRAAAAYAAARETGEGDCASSGLRVTGDRYGDAWVAVVRGQAAESAGDVEGATTAYRAAAALDVDNPAAREALGRLQQEVPVLREPDPVAPVVVTAPVPVWLLVLAVVAVVLLAAVVALLGWGVWRRRGRATAAETDGMLASALAANATKVEEVVEAVQQRLAQLPTELYAAAQQRADALEHHLEGIIDVLDDAVATGGRPVRRRFERPDP